MQQWQGADATCWHCCSSVGQRHWDEVLRCAKEYEHVYRSGPPLTACAHCDALFPIQCLASGHQCKPVGKQRYFTWQHLPDNVKDLCVTSVSLLRGRPCDQGPLVRVNHGNNTGNQLSNHGNHLGNQRPIGHAACRSAMYFLMPQSFSVSKAVCLYSKAGAKERSRPLLPISIPSGSATPDAVRRGRRFQRGREREEQRGTAMPSRLKNATVVRSYQSLKA